MLTHEKQKSDVDRIIREYYGEPMFGKTPPAWVKPMLEKTWDAGWDQGFKEGEEIEDEAEEAQYCQVRDGDETEDSLAEDVARAERAAWDPNP